MSESAAETRPPAKKEARIVVPFRVAPNGKAAIQAEAERRGYDKYTEWIRDVLAAECRNPKHRPTPRKKEQK